jgi:hypothetical protein
MILNVCPLLPPCPVLAVPFLRRMHWFAAKLFLESFSVGLFSKHEHPIVLILPGDRVTVGKFTLPAEVPELVVVLPDALVFVERYPERGPAEYAPVGVATVSPETPLARAVDSVVSAWISNPPDRDLIDQRRQLRFSATKRRGVDADGDLFFRWSATY